MIFVWSSGGKTAWSAGSRKVVEGRQAALHKSVHPFSSGHDVAAELFGYRCDGAVVDDFQYDTGAFDQALRRRAFARELFKLLALVVGKGDQRSFW